MFDPNNTLIQQVEKSVPADFNNSQVAPLLLTVGGIEINGIVMLI